MLLWLDGDQFDNWHDLVEHLWMIGEVEYRESGFIGYKGVYYREDELIEVLKPLVELNAQLYDAWALLYEFKDLDTPHSLEPFKEKVVAYLEETTGRRLD